MNDQNSIENEGKFEKWDRGRSLFLESLYKADHELRGCSHNQKCFNELMEIREYIIDHVRNMKNPHIGRPAKAGDKNNAPPVKAINGISVTLLSGALGPHYMQDWSEEHKKEWEEYVVGSNT
tara:strand:+ start:450 stop:815 length:366 start_codon:yes stop_codon:yes gene_type:complete